MICEKCRCPRPESGQCRGCKKLYMEEYRLKNKEKIALSQQKWYQNNREKIIIKNTEYYENNIDEQREKRKVYQAQHKIERCERDRNRRRSDPAYSLRRNFSSKISIALKGNKNRLSILQFLPYTIDELKCHLEKQFDDKMTWNNYGIYWHIDHIIPQSILPYVSMTDDNFKRCWSLSNLRPLEAIENIRKSNKMIGDK